MCFQKTGVDILFILDLLQRWFFLNDIFQSIVEGLWFMSNIEDRGECDWSSFVRHHAPGCLILILRGCQVELKSFLWCACSDSWLCSLIFTTLNLAWNVAIVFVRGIVSVNDVLFLFIVVHLSWCTNSAWVLVHSLHFLDVECQLIDVRVDLGLQICLLFWFLFHLITSRILF